MNAQKQTCERIYALHHHLKWNPSSISRTSHSKNWWQRLWESKEERNKRIAEEKDNSWLPSLNAMRRTGTKTSRELAAYAGVYQHPAYGDATVEVDGAALELRWSNWRVPLEHFHFDVFRAGGEAVFFRDSLVRFQLGDAGAVQTVRFINQEFRRKP